MNLVKLASQRLRMMEKKKNENLSQFEKLVSVVRKEWSFTVVVDLSRIYISHDTGRSLITSLQQLSLSIAKVLSNNFKIEASYLSSAVALVSMPISGCFRGDTDSNKMAEVTPKLFMILN